MAIRKRVKHYPGQIKEAVSQMNDMRTGGMLYDLLSATPPVYENDTQLRQKFLNFPKPAISPGATVSASRVNFPLVPTVRYKESAKILSDLGAIMARGHQEIPTPEAASGISDVLAWEASTHAIRTQLSAEDEKRRLAMSAVPLLPYNSPIRAGLTSDVAKKIEKQRIAKDAIRFAERAEVGKQADDLIKSMSGGKMPPAQKNAQIDTTAKGIERGFKRSGTIRELRKAFMVGSAGVVARNVVMGYIVQELKAAKYGQDISSAALVTGTDPETMAKWSYALRTVGGSEASATKLFAGINNLLQGALMGESSPYFNVAEKYGLKLTGRGAGGLATESELLDRLSEFFRTETSGRKKAHLASILGFDAATIRLLSMSKTDIDEKLSDEGAFTAEEIKDFEDTQMRVNEMMVKFENSLIRIVTENGLFDKMLTGGEKFVGWLDRVARGEEKFVDWIYRVAGIEKNNVNKNVFTEQEKEWLGRRIIAEDWFGLGEGRGFLTTPAMNYELMKYQESAPVQKFEINLKGDFRDSYGNAIDIQRAYWASPDQSLRINIQ